LPNYDQRIPINPNTMQPIMPGMGVSQQPNMSPSMMQRFAGGLRGFANNPDLAMALLANSGGSPQKRSFGEIMGASMMQAQGMQQQRQNADFERQLMEARINQLKNPVRKPIAVMGPDGSPVFADEQDAIGKTPVSMGNGAEAPASIQEFQLAKSQGYPGSFEQWLKDKAQFAPVNPTVQLINGVPTVVQPNRSGGAVVKPLSSQQSEFDAASGVAGAKAGGAKSAERMQAQIDTGLDAADSLATVKRGLQLLDSVGTGGIDAAKLKATQMFGITGADESELSANLGKAVLSQLRATFGAQFTEKEGERLATIEAGFGKSTEGNRRLLQQAETILDRAARRGLKAAQDSGDTFTAEEIRKSMNFSLDPNNKTQPDADGWTTINGVRIREKK